MSKVHFDQYKSNQQTWLINHLAGLLRWAKRERPDLLEAPHELLSHWLKNAVLPPSILSMAHRDIEFVAACHHFLDDYADKADFYPDLPEYAPQWGGPRGIQPAQREYLLKLIAKLPENHSARKLDLNKLSSQDAGRWIDKLKLETSRTA